MLQAASSALFSTRSTPVWTMRGVYRQDAAQIFQKCLADILIYLHVLTSSHRGGAHNADPQMMCAATFHASYNK